MGWTDGQTAPSSPRCRSVPIPSAPAGAGKTHPRLQLSPQSSPFQGRAFRAQPGDFSSLGNHRARGQGGDGSWRGFAFRPRSERRECSPLCVDVISGWEVVICLLAALAVGSQGCQRSRRTGASSHQSRWKWICASHSPHRGWTGPFAAAPEPGASPGCSINNCHEQQGLAHPPCLSPETALLSQRCSRAEPEAPAGSQRWPHVPRGGTGQAGMSPQSRSLRNGDPHPPGPWWLFQNLSLQNHPNPSHPTGLVSHGDINLSLRVTKVWLCPQLGFWPGRGEIRRAGSLPRALLGVLGAGNAADQGSRSC